MLREISDREWLGVPEESQEPVNLNAGVLSAQFLNGRLINYSYAGEVVLLEVYFALRDRNWNTIPYKIRDQKIEEGEEGFILTFHAEHQKEGFLYDWEGRICGDASGSITYEFEGRAGCDFLSNRIGFCILHPAECAGKPCEILHSDGIVEKGSFPERISPHQPFFNISEIRYEKDDGVKVVTTMDGDVFEMEDQRNWTDASFKTYCTPLALPFPVETKTGDTVRQSIKVRLELSDDVVKEAASERSFQADVIDLSKGKEGTSLKLGTIIRKVPDKRQQELLSYLGVSHVRCELRFAEDLSWFDNVASCMQNLQIPIRIAVFFTKDWEKELEKLCEVLDKWKLQVLDALIFMEREKVICPEILKSIRDRLCAYRIPVGSGTDAFFTQDNREPLPPELLDLAVYSNNPQVHAFDNDSIMLTTAGQMANVKSCMELFPNKKIVVSPVSLKMRWNPDLTGEEVIPAHTMPMFVDPRQMSLFTASWTVRSIASLSAAGADSADYYEFLGSTGLMQDRELPDYDFPAEGGMIYPVYYSMRFLAGIHRMKVNAWLEKKYAALLLESGTSRKLIIANNTKEPLELGVNGLSGNVSAMRVNLDTVRELAGSEPAPERMGEELIDGRFVLKAYETICIYC